MPVRFSYVLLVIAITAPLAQAVDPVLKLDSVSLAAFSPDAKSLLTVSAKDKQVHFWDVSTGEETNRFGDSVTGALFSANGARVVTWGSDKVVRIFDARTGKALKRLGEDPLPVQSAAISPTGSHVITSTETEPFARLWDASTGQLLKKLEGHTSPIVFVTFAPDGQTFATASGVPGVAPNTNWAGTPAKTDAPAPPDQSIRFWSLTEPKPIQQITLKSCPQAGVFSANSKLFLVALQPKPIIFNIADAAEVPLPKTPEEFFPAGASTADRKQTLRVAIGSAAIVDTQTSQEIKPLESPIDGLTTCYAFSPDGAKIILGTGKAALFSRNPTAPGTVYVYDVATAKQLMALTGHPVQLQQVAFAPDARHAFSRDAQSHLLLWNLAQ